MEEFVEKMTKCNMEERVQKCHFETDVPFDELLYQWVLFDIFYLYLMVKLLSRCIKYVWMMKIFFSNLELYTIVWSLEIHFFAHFIFIYNDYTNFGKKKCYWKVCIIIKECLCNSHARRKREIFIFFCCQKYLVPNYTIFTCSD